MDFKAIFKQIQIVYRKLNLRQKLTILGTVVALAIFIAFLLVYSGKPSQQTSSGYMTLFEGLSPQDSALVLQHLQQNQIPYEIPKENTIAIPAEQVYQQRIILAGNGIPKSSKVGFEIFNTPQFGETDFDQKVKLLRATEGELTRTIESLNPVEKAIVKIAQPKESVFTSQAVPPTASIVLHVRPNMTLTPAQIIGIKNLTAAAVTSLSPDNVKITNAEGEPLGEDDGLTGAKEAAAMQRNHKRAEERALEEKIITVLAPIIGGRDRVVAQVTAEFDFSQKQSTKESYGPNSFVISEQNIEEKREGYKPKEIGGVPGTVSNIGPVQGLDNQDIREKYERTESTVNNVIDREVASIKGEFATLKRLSAAVVVDGHYRVNINDAGMEELEYIPLSDDAMAQIANQVRQAIGFNADRDDRVTVSNFEFNATTAGYVPKSAFERFILAAQKLLGPFAPLFKYLVVAFILFVFYKKVIAPFMERMLEIQEDEDEEIESLIRLEDDDEDSRNKLNEMRKKVEDQLGLSTGLNEDEVKYDILLEKLKALLQERPDDVASVFQALVRDELGIDESKALAEKK